MNDPNMKILAAATALLAILSAPARADLTASLIPLDTHQVGTQGVIRFGTVVQAHTNLNGLWASASYRIECWDPNIRPALTGSRGYSNNGLFGPRNVYVTAPEWVPYEQALPGWQRVMGGTYVSCVNTHSAQARTTIVPIGGGGTNVSIGGDIWEHSLQQTFGVIKPGTSFGGGCIM